VLRELASGLWVAERKLRFLGVELGTRMTVMRLGDGSLLVHSPIDPLPTLRAELDRAGRVRFIAAPNRLHHLFAAAFREACPGSELHAAPGLAERFPGLPIDAVLSDEPAGWSADVDHHRVKGIPATNEVAFHHRPSRTLVLTDLAFNIGPEAPPWTRFSMRVAGAYGHFGPSRIERILIRDRAAARASFERILAWDFDRVVVGHGRVLESGGRRALRRSYDWLLGG
jgi:hypothetical protein